MTALWTKGLAAAEAEVIAFAAGDDAALDARLIPYDIIGSIAHARGLEKIGVLGGAEAKAICKALCGLKRDWEDGRFSIRPEDEDCHTAIERALAERLGEAGRKIHAGRSRNDQVQTALGLLMKDALLNSMDAVANLAAAACAEGAKGAAILMPGYTHMQRAMPTTLASWHASFAQGWADALDSGIALHGRLDQSPLGSAAGFGAPLPLDRPYTAELMGFSRVQVNAQAVQASRGRHEAALLGWLLDASQDAGKMAWDLLIFSTAEYGFVRIPARFCTGSSMMPQKRNADVLELIRALPAAIKSCRDEAEEIALKLPSGYHRDLQLTKAPLLRGLDRCRAAFGILAKLLPALGWDIERLAAAMSPEMFAAHRATELARGGMPFRDAYAHAARELAEGKAKGWPAAFKDAVTGPTHLGAPGNPGIAEARERIISSRDWISNTREALHGRWDELLARDKITAD